MNIRRATFVDAKEIRDLNVETIQKVNAKDYTLQEINVWSSFNKIEAWEDAINQQKFWVVIKENKIIGFGSLTPNGLLDFLFVHYADQRVGIASVIEEEIEKEARSQSNEKLFASVSITAQPFFLSKGYTIDRMESKALKGEIFINAQMEKILK